MSNNSLECIEVESGAAPQMTIIWLHGLGADGHDFEPIVPELRLPFPARFVFPHAPVRPVTINGGIPMRAWFDILSLTRGEREDAVGIEASAAMIAALLDAERARGRAAEQIIIAGFSQGGALALHLGLRYPERLAGIVALSCFVPLADRLAAESSPAARGVPIFMAHGADDEVVPQSYAQRGREQLSAAGFEPQWHSYPMGHGVCPQEIADLSEWLQGVARSL